MPITGLHLPRAHDCHHASDHGFAWSGPNALAEALTRDRVHDRLRVHVGPSGRGHTCRVIGVGNDVETPSTRRIAALDARGDDVVGAFVEGRPAELVQRNRVAIEDEVTFVDACRPCCVARSRVRSSHRRVRSSHWRVRSSHRRVCSSHRRVRSSHWRVRSSHRRVRSSHPRILVPDVAHGA